MRENGGVKGIARVEQPGQLAYRERCGAQGTHSILDIRHVSHEPAKYSISPLSAERVKELDMPFLLVHGELDPRRVRAHHVVALARIEGGVIRPEVVFAAEAG